MEVCAAVARVSWTSSSSWARPTVCVAVVLYGDTQDSETMVPDRSILHARLVFEYVVDGLGEEGDESVSFRCRVEYAA